MTFNTALSGLKAASTDLGAIGNNIANASTVGFKSSRAEFGDVYASSVVGSGQNSVGSGVVLENVAQQFSQGNVTFTENALDLAINGEGFFLLDNNGALRFSRAGTFSLNQDGFVVNNSGHRLQGFPVDDTGAVGVALGDLQLLSDSIDPERTTGVSTVVNLDASSNVLATRGTTADTLGTEISNTQTGTNNGYTAEGINITFADGSVTTVNSLLNETASSFAAKFTALQGVSANATTEVRVTGYNNTGASTIQLNGVTLTAANPAALATEIATLTNTTLPGISASEAAGVLTITSSTGTDLRFAVNNSGTGADTLTVQGLMNGGLVGGAVTISGAGGGDATTGGIVHVTMDENIAVGTGAGNLFTPVVTQTAFINNSFDAASASSYNAATSITIYDSLGNGHTMTEFFVKEPAINTWTMYLTIDGLNVGDPNVALPPPANIAPTRASYNIVFNNDGSLDTAASDSVLVSYWNPVNSSGNPNGSVNSQTVANGGTLPIPLPAASSNFEVRFAGTTQFGSPFSVNDLNQDGFSTGRLAGVQIASTGEIFARFSNGKSDILGQVALTSFRNPQGLNPLGGSTWAETFESGNPVMGTPGTSSLGTIKSGALEDSNVELSQELVNLIIAQRNFQANAKTIQTADSVTQTIINLR